MFPPCVSFSSATNFFVSTPSEDWYRPAGAPAVFSTASLTSMAPLLALPPLLLLLLDSFCRFAGPLPDMPLSNY